jgi:anti-sigma factor RsiW
MADGPDQTDEHQVFESDFSDYYDGTLSAERRAALEAHLTACGRCRAEYDKLREAVSQVALLGRASAPPDLEERVAQTIHRRSAGRFFGKRVFGDRVPFEVLALIALILLVGVYVLARMRS